MQEFANPINIIYKYSGNSQHFQFLKLILVFPLVILNLLTEIFLWSQGLFFYDKPDSMFIKFANMATFMLRLSFATVATILILTNLVYSSISMPILSGIDKFANSQDGFLDLLIPRFKQVLQGISKQVSSLLFLLVGISLVSLKNESNQALLTPKTKEPTPPPRHITQSNCLDIAPLPTGASSPCIVNLSPKPNATNVNQLNTHPQRDPPPISLDMSSYGLNASCIKDIGICGRSLKNITLSFLLQIILAHSQNVKLEEIITLEYPESGDPIQITNSRLIKLLEGKIHVIPVFTYNENQDDQLEEKDGHWMIIVLDNIKKQAVFFNSLGRFSRKSTMNNKDLLSRIIEGEPNQLAIHDPVNNKNYLQGSLRQNSSNACGIFCVAFLSNYLAYSNTKALADIIKELRQLDVKTIRRFYRELSNIYFTNKPEQRTGSKIATLLKRYHEPYQGIIHTYYSRSIASQVL